MALLSGSASGNSVPDNVTSGDFTVTVDTAPGHVCGGTVQPFVLDDSLGMTAGRWVLLRALASIGGITGYAGATVTPPAGLAVHSVNRQTVNYAGVPYDCIVVTLVPAA